MTLVYMHSYIALCVECRTGSPVKFGGWGVCSGHVSNILFTSFVNVFRY